MKMETFYESPIGIIRIESDQHAITALDFVDEENSSINSALPEDPVLNECINQLDEYFQGKRQKFTVKLNPQGGTEFQNRVWKELLKIPFGETQSYLDIALRVADRNATRAVGNANGKNKISIIIPCHRVIGKSGKLVGYGGGLHRKKWLLDHEAKQRWKAFSE